MAATEIDVKYVAHLARIALTPDEEEKLGAQLGNILGYIEKLKELDVTNVEPTAHAVPMVNVTRARRNPAVAAARGSAAQRARPGQRTVHRAQNRGITLTRIFRC